MNSGNNRNSGPHGLLLYLPDNINLKVSDKYFAFSNLNIPYP